MKVHLIRKETIASYVIANARSRPSFGDWLTKIRHADWEKPADIQSTFGSADLLGNLVELFLILEATITE